MPDYSQPEVAVRYEDNFRYHLVRSEPDEYGEVRWGEDFNRGSHDYMSWIESNGLTQTNGFLVTDIHLFTSAVVTLKHPENLKTIDFITGQYVTAVEEIQGRNLHIADIAEHVFLAGVNEDGRNIYRTAEEILAEERLPDIMTKWLSLCARTNRWDGPSYDKFVRKIDGVKSHYDLRRRQRDTSAF